MQHETTDELAPGIKLRLPSTSSRGGDCLEAEVARLQGEMDNPLLDYLGVRLEKLGPGFCSVYLDLDDRHLNRQRTLQGGVAATLLDAACGYAGFQADISSPPGRSVTVGLTVNYLSTVSAGRIRATGNLIRSGRSIYFCTGELVSDTGVLVAIAQGSFKRIHFKRAS